MTGRVFLVTGAAVGFGRESALLLAEAGDRVFALDRDEARLSRLPDTITPVVADLLDRASIEAAVAAFVVGAEVPERPGRLANTAAAGTPRARSARQLAARGS